MADKTTTLKTKTNDNVYPNIIGDNMDNAIVDSAHINHTLTAAHKINFRLDTNVSKLIFNSLQKPEGLTKTKLVGVGTNGQENIEIGDNLTLANGKLSASGGGAKIIKHHAPFLISVPLKEYALGDTIKINEYPLSMDEYNSIISFYLDSDSVIEITGVQFLITCSIYNFGLKTTAICTKSGTVTSNPGYNLSYIYLTRK